MSTLTTSEQARPNPFIDKNSIDRSFGGRIGWDYVSNRWRRGSALVKAAAAAARAATAITVDALTKALQVGDLLDFGSRSAVTVTTTATANAAATTIAVSALSGPIPNGTLLDFGSGAGLFALLTAAAAAGATSLTVEALPEQIASGKTATYAGGRKLARVSAPAAIGDTSVSVAALEFAIDNDDEAYVGGGFGAKVIPAFTVFCKLSSGLHVPRADRPGSETASLILMAEAVEDRDSDSLTGQGFARRGDVWENLLPDVDSAGDLPSAYKTELEAVGFTFQDYVDNRS